MTPRIWRRIRWAAVTVLAAGISGLTALGRPASSALPPPVTLRGNAPVPAATDFELVVVTPPVVVFVPAEDDAGSDSIDSPFEEDNWRPTDDAGSADSVDDLETDVASADSPDGGD
jgi:hypothetical protein